MARPTQMIEMKNPKIPNPADLHSSFSNPMGDSKLLNMKTMEVDKPLCAIGFEHDVISASLVSGHLFITENCTQPFRVLHGGVSALIAESLASTGAHIASGFKRVAGVQLSINHHKPAFIGDNVIAEATPITVGRTVQVWNVELWKCDVSTMKKKVLVSSSRVTLLSNMPVPEDSKEAEIKLRKHAKL
ncbi:Thioesterase family protein [Zostera marina]|uniref:Thioesterase family protein n=1 Tax=Zostera marina TaxID=29655 RepID=A0A0K9PID0_ZOSMR|nr:Thioesterase family protein [Zostera marina]